MIECLELPPLDGQSLVGAPWAIPESGFLIGAFGLPAVSELGIWRRLFESANLPYTLLFLSEAWSPSQKQAVLGAFPTSIHGRVVLAADPRELWRELIQPDRPERSFAVFRGPQSTQIIVGAPTEDVWERVLMDIQQA